MACLMSLPNELLLMIVEDIGRSEESTRTHTLNALLRTSRQFFVLTESELYKKITIRSRKVDDTLSLTLVRHGHLKEHIQEVTLSGSCSNYISMYWLNSFPNLAKVHISEQSVGADSFKDIVDQLNTLHHNLESLHFITSACRHQPGATENLQRLAACTKLKRLTINCELLDSACLCPAYDHFTALLDPVRLSSLLPPTLEELRIVGSQCVAWGPVQQRNQLDNLLAAVAHGRLPKLRSLYVTSHPMWQEDHDRVVELRERFGDCGIHLRWELGATTVSRRAAGVPPANNKPKLRAGCARSYMVVGGTEKFRL